MSSEFLDSGNYDFEALEKQRLEEQKRRGLKSGTKSFKAEEFKGEEEDDYVSQAPRSEFERPIGGAKVEFEDDPEQFAREQEENLKELEDIPSNKRAVADALNQIFDEDIIKHMFSSKWQQREKGYEMANSYTLSILQKADDVIAIQKLIFGVIQEGLMDKIVQVNLKAMKI